MKVLIFPKGDNPYQELLYRELRLRHPSDTYAYYSLSAARLFFFPLLVSLYRLRGYRLFHIHWPAFAINRPIPGIRYVSLIHALVCLTVLRLLGYKIIWTVHNIVPHNSETANDLLVARYLADIATGKIVHSQTTIGTMKLKKMDTSRSVTIPHGNYTNWYPQGATAAQARRKFDIPHNAFVVVFVGRIEPYKNVPELIRACESLAAKRPVHVLIGGKASPELTRQLSRYANDTIHLQLRFIEDGELQYFFAAADIAAYPFTEITTSGSALLAISFGVPIIAPRIGALTDIPQTAGFFYDPAKQTFQTALQQAIDDPQKLAAARVAAATYRESLNWDTIARQTYRLYDRLDRNGRI